MTPQEIFDTVVTHLRKQVVRSVSLTDDPEYGPCRYRTAITNKDGSETILKCAAGCLITDEEYAGWMEGLRFVGVLTRNTCPKSLLERIPDDYNNLDISSRVNLISELQNLHDHGSPSSWEEGFQNLAERFKLNYTSPVDDADTP